MRPLKGEKYLIPKRVQFNIQIDEEIVETMNEMEKYSKISKEEHVETALRRYITSHKDYLPE